MGAVDTSLRDLAEWLGDHLPESALDSAADRCGIEHLQGSELGAAVRWHHLLQRAAEEGCLHDALAPAAESTDPLARALAEAAVPTGSSVNAIEVPASRRAAVAPALLVFSIFVVAAWLLPSAPIFPEETSEYGVGRPTDDDVRRRQEKAAPIQRGRDSRSGAGRSSEAVARPSQPPVDPGDVAEPTDDTPTPVGLDPLSGLEVDLSKLPPPVEGPRGRVTVDDQEISPDITEGRTTPLPSSGAPPVEEPPAGGSAEPPAADPPDAPQSLPAAPADQSGSGAPPEATAAGEPSDGRDCRPGDDVRQWPCRRLYLRPAGCPESPEGYVGWWWAGPTYPGAAGAMLEVKRPVNLRCDRPRPENGYDAAMPVAGSLSRGHWVRVSGEPVKVGSSWYVPLRQGDYPIPESER